MPINTHLVIDTVCKTNSSASNQLSISVANSKSITVLNIIITCTPQSFCRTSSSMSVQTLQTCRRTFHSGKYLSPLRSALYTSLPLYGQAHALKHGLVSLLFLHFCQLYHFFKKLNSSHVLSVIFFVRCFAVFAIHTFYTFFKLF